MKDRVPRDYRELLRAGKWFRSLPDDFQTELLDAGTLKRFATGQTVMTRGEPRRGLFGVLEGSIRVGHSNEQGDETILVFAEPPTWFGEISAVDGGPMTHDAVADRPSIVLHVAAEPLDGVLNRKPARWRDLGRLMTIKVRLLYSTLEEQALPPVALLAHRLVMITEGYGGWDDRTARVLAVSQEQLATMLSLSRQTVNQVLKELEKKKIIKRVYAGVEIVDLSGLRRTAQMLMP